MGAQNFVALGLDVSQFGATQEATLTKFIGLFEKLSQYDGKVINPVFGSGLAEFNAAASSSAKILDDLNAKILQLSKNSRSSGEDITKVVVQTELLTEETAKLAVELEEANKALLDNAKAQNATVQARNAATKAANDSRRAEKEFEQARKEATAQSKQIDSDEATARKKNEAQIENARRQAIAQNKEYDASKQQLIRTEREEANATQILSNKLLQLKNIQKEQAITFTNSFVNTGKNSPQTRQALDDLTATSTVVNEVEKNLNRATEGAGKFGKGLTSAFSQIRTLAYILPGIGIAGLFNLAFEAIGKAVEALGLFDSESEKYINTQISINKALQEFLKIQKEVEDAYKTNLGNVQYGEDLLKSTEAGNKSLRDRLSLEINLANLKSNSSNAKFFETGGFTTEEQLRHQLDNAERELISAQKRVSQNEQGIHRESEYGFGNYDEEEKKQLELANLKFNIAKDAYNKQKKINEDNATDLEDYNSKIIKLTVFNEEEIRKAKLESAKRQADDNKNKNDLILSDDITNLKDRLAAISSNYAQERAKQEAQIQYIKSKPDSYNTFDQYGNAIKPELTQDALTQIKDAGQKIAEAKRESDRKIENTEEEFRQRRIKALAEINKDSIEQSAIADEKVYKNESKTLDERLSALNSYIIKKQQLQDIEYNLDIDTRKLKSNDPASRLEKAKLDSDRIKQQANIQADVEKSVYDIVFTSTQKQLALVTAENKFEEEKHRESYGLQLRELNESFRKKEISYRTYNKERNKIDVEYGRSSLDAVIKDDEVALKRNQDQLTKLVKLREGARAKLDPAKDILDLTKEEGGDTLGPQKDYDSALGEYEGYQDGVIKSEAKTHDSVNKLKEDTFKRDSLRYQQDQKLRQQYFQAAKQIEESLYRTVKELGDQEYQYELQQLALKKATIEEQYGLEKDAIANSSLDAKNKAALDVQLDAQRRQAAEENAKEERRIKHDQAVFDRDIAIAHIILSTAEAVAASLEIPVLAVAAGIAGAAELVIAENVKIPAYKDGVKNKATAGISRFGEAGWEVVVEPYKSPYLVTKETVGWLPKGTDVIPFKDHPELGGSVAKDDSWKQTMFLAKQIKKYNQNRAVVNNITIDLGKASYRSLILGR